MLQQPLSLPLTVGDDDCGRHDIPSSLAIVQDQPKLHGERHVMNI